MSQRLRATFHLGAFIPQQPCEIPEGSEVELIVEGTTILAPEETDPETRRLILIELVESIRRHPFPRGTPLFTREELHDR